MQTSDRVIYRGNIPSKNKFYVAIFWLDLKLIQLILKPIILKFFLKKVKRTDFIPGFRSFYGNIIGEDCFLADANFIDYAPIYIGKGTHIGFGNTFITAHHNPNDFSEIICDPIYIGEGVTFGYNVLVLQGVRIGNGVCIGAGSVITKDIPDNCIVGGNPAKVIKFL